MDAAANGGLPRHGVDRFYRYETKFKLSVRLICRRRMTERGSYLRRDLGR
jgi:hypothetical protein